MQSVLRILLTMGCAVALLSPATAQAPVEKPNPGKEAAKDYSNSPIVVRMMAFDRNKDGKLTKDEVTDARLHRLFDRADANKDGVVTREELLALAAQLDAEYPQRSGRGGFGGPGGPGPGGPGGFGGRGGRGPGGPGGRGFGGPGGGGPGGPGAGGPGGGTPSGSGGRGAGGPGGFGGPPRPGQILPSFLQDDLNLTSDQKKKLGQLQKEVEEKLAKILTDEQRKQLEDMRRGGFGPGGPGGPPPDGPPPDGLPSGGRGRGGPAGSPGGGGPPRAAPDRGR